MKKKVLIIVIITLIIVIIILGIFGVKKFIGEYREDRKNTRYILDKIVVDYSDFESKIEPYNKNLTELINLLNDSSYYDKVKKNKDKIVNLLDEVTSQIEELSNYSILKENCNKKYANGKASRSCSSYTKTYEKSVNIYIDVVKAYNNIVKKVNEISSDNKISAYEAKFIDYIDCNNDGIFAGKGEIAKEKEVDNRE